MTAPDEEPTPEERILSLVEGDAALIRMAEADALRRAADDWPEDGMTRAEAQAWLSARAEAVSNGD